MSARNAGLLERFGRSRLSAWDVGAASAAGEQPVHLLDAAERRAVKRIERWAIGRAALVGALSALASAVAEMAVQSHEESDPLRFWLVVGGVTVVASVIEIGFLSFDALRSVASLARAAGIAVEDREARTEVVASLARAALEVPDPIESKVGINPFRESSKIVLVLAALVYKLKVSATNVLLKLVVRRALGRAVVRTWLPLLSIPGTAVWNAVVCAVVLRQARVRIFGRSLVEDVVRRLMTDGAPASLSFKEACARAVGSCIVRSAYLHPNLELLLEMVVAKNDGRPRDVDDTRLFLDSFGRLQGEERRAVLRMLTAAAVIDGKLARRELLLLREAAAASGVPLDLKAVRQDCKRVRAGEPLALA